MSRRVLLVDDEAPFRRFAGGFLEESGFEVAHAPDALTALRLAEERAPDLVLLDLNLPDVHGLEVLRRLRAQRGDLRIIVLTSYGDAQNAVAALKAGATDYLTKPIELQKLLDAARAALEGPAAAAPSAMKTSGAHRRRAPTIGEGEDELDGASPPWLATLDRLERIAESDLPTALLLGESGTGKNMLARRLHRLGKRAAGPFVELDCASIPEALLESELFGHERGAFTGATARKQGQVELASGGTLFLDEVGELPFALQPKLLRFIERRRFRRVGGLDDLETDVHIVCATNRDLRREVERGAFRQDLFYRLEVVSLEVPPLRARGDDALLIARRTLERHAARLGRPAPVLSPAAEQALRAHPFPGNVRELVNVLRRALAFASGPELSPGDLELGGSPTDRFVRPREAPASAPAPDRVQPIELEPVLQALEARWLQLALDRHESQREAAAALGIDRFALARRLNKLARGGGAAGAQAGLEGLPAWLSSIIGPLPDRLPDAGVDLPSRIRDVEEQAIAFAVRAAEGNRARAATLLGMSRTSLNRKLEAR